MPGAQIDGWPPPVGPGPVDGGLHIAPAAPAGQEAGEDVYVLPGVGPVGIENSWVVTNEGIEKLTNCNEEIIELK